MKKLLLASLFFFVLSVAANAQSASARMIEEIPRLPCGHMMAILDGLLAEWAKDTDNRIVTIYYGHRYRKNTRAGKDGKSKVTELYYAHRDDGLNWAKGIPRYLVARLSSRGRDGSAEDRDILDRLQKNTVLIDGGYREEIFAQIWLVPPTAENPRPTIHLTESQIKFGASLPRPVPDYYNCYAAY